MSWPYGGIHVVCVFYIYISFMLVVFRMAAAGDVNLFDAEVDKYAAFRDLSTAADNAGACFLR